jgi:hypothetical protein
LKIITVGTPTNDILYHTTHVKLSHPFAEVTTVITIRPKSSYNNSPTMSPERVFTPEKAKEIGETLGVDWTKFDVEQFRIGMDVELEHGTEDPNTNVTDDDPLTTGKIALAHLNEFPDYYTRLLKLEEEAEEYWENREE